MNKEIILLKEQSYKYELLYFQAKSRNELLEEKLESINKKIKNTQDNEERQMLLDWLLSIKDIKDKLKIANKTTLQLIVDILKVDINEQIKNSLKYINKENWDNTISFLDWAISRDEWLINFLKPYLVIKEPLKYITKEHNK